MDPIKILEIVFGTISAIAAITRLFTHLFKYFKKLKEYRIMRYFRHLQDLMQTYNNFRTFNTAELQDFKFYLGKAQRADYKRKLKDAGQEDVLREAEELEDKLDGVKLIEDGHEEY